MGFWIFMLVTDMIIPLIIIGFGRLFLKAAPKEINILFGYRSNMSMKNRDTWEFAHQYCGRLWYRWGLVLLPVTVIAMLAIAVMGKGTGFVGTAGSIVCLIQLVPLSGAVFPTERALRRTFDKDGNRR